MADTHTPSLRLRLLEVGANEDTWGDELNSNVISMIEEAVAGIVSISVTAGNVTLSTANGTTDQARNALILLTGTPGATRTVTFPDVEKLSWVINAVSDSSSITCTAGAGTTVSIPAGSCALVYTDGATNAAAVPIASLAGGKLGIGMTPSNVLDITQNQNTDSNVQILNSNSGTAAQAAFYGNNGTSSTKLTHFGTGYTTNGLNRQNGGLVQSTGAGGLTLNTTLNQPIYIGVNNTEVARFDSSKLDLAVGQIKFPASQSASADANTLDDYEEGTWTPTLGDGTNNYTLSTAEGYYTKIGNRVYWESTCIWTSIGSAGAGQLTLGGLPFTTANVGVIRFGNALGRYEGLDLTATLNPIISVCGANATVAIFFRANDNTAVTNLPANSSSAPGIIIISGTYRV